MPPVNDEPSGAVVIGGVKGTRRGSNVGATAETWLTLPGQVTKWKGSLASSVWFSYISPIDGLVQFDLIGSAFSGALNAYVGEPGAGADPGTLRLVEGFADSVDDTSAVHLFDQAAIRVPVTAGARYLIMVDGGPGAYVLNWQAYRRGADRRLLVFESHFNTVQWWAVDRDSGRVQDWVWDPQLFGRDAYPFPGAVLDGKRWVVSFPNRNLLALFEEGLAVLPAGAQVGSPLDSGGLATGLGHGVRDMVHGTSGGADYAYRWVGVHGGDIIAAVNSPSGPDPSVVRLSASGVLLEQYFVPAAPGPDGAAWVAVGGFCDIDASGVLFFPGDHAVGRYDLASHTRLADFVVLDDLQAVTLRCRTDGRVTAMVMKPDGFPHSEWFRLYSDDSSSATQLLTTTEQTFGAGLGRWASDDSFDVTVTTDTTPAPPVGSHVMRSYNHASSSVEAGPTITLTAPGPAGIVVVSGYVYFSDDGLGSVMFLNSQPHSPIAPAVGGVWHPFTVQTSLTGTGLRVDLDVGIVTSPGVAPSTASYAGMSVSWRPVTTPDVEFRYIPYPYQVGGPSLIPGDTENGLFAYVNFTSDPDDEDWVWTAHTATFDSTIDHVFHSNGYALRIPLLGTPTQRTAAMQTPVFTFPDIPSGFGSEHGEIRFVTGGLWEKAVPLSTASVTGVQLRKDRLN